MARAEAQVETKSSFNRPSLNNNGGASQAVQQAPKIGLEDKDDLWADLSAGLERALAKANAEAAA